MRNKLVLGLGALIAILVGIGIAYFVFKKQVNDQASDSLSNSSSTKTQAIVGHEPCLHDDEYADYPLDPKYDKATLLPKLPLIVSIRDKKRSEEKFKFQIDDVFFSAHPLELKKCNVYVMREFNYDSKAGKALSGFSQEIWSYAYNGQGKKLITLAKKGTDGKEEVSYQFYFHINENESYITLTRGYLGSKDYAVVVKDLKTLNDVFVLTWDNLVNNYGISKSEIGSGSWVDNDTFPVFVTDGAAAWDEVVVHKDKDNKWNFVIYKFPDDANSVTAYNPDGYWIAYNNGPGWIGVVEVEQEVYKQWRDEGKKISLFVYNLATKQKITLATIDDPGWSFKTKWLSATELQYILPSGEKKIFTIPGR